MRLIQSPFCLIKPIKCPRLRNTNTMLSVLFPTFYGYVISFSIVIPLQQQVLDKYPPEILRCDSVYLDDIFVTKNCFLTSHKKQIHEAKKKALCSSFSCRGHECISQCLRGSPQLFLTPFQRIHPPLLVSVNMVHAHDTHMFSQSNTHR